MGRLLYSKGTPDGASENFQSIKAKALPDKRVQYQSPNQKVEDIELPPVKPRIVDLHRDQLGNYSEKPKLEYAEDQGEFTDASKINPLEQWWVDAKHSKLLDNPYVDYTPLSALKMAPDIPYNFYSGGKDLINGNYRSGAKKMITGSVEAVLTGTAATFLKRQASMALTRYLTKKI